MDVNAKFLLQIEEDDIEEHPCCPHGPTVLFYRQNQSPIEGFYACSAHRNPKLCPFHMEAIYWKHNKTKRIPAIREYPQSKKERIVDADPTTHLKALSQDDVHAQYFFDQNAVNFITDQCRSLGIDKVVCVGTPRLHFHLRRVHKMKSFLLDFDERFSDYLNPEEFCLYNMCNNYFFYNRQPFEIFLKCTNDERVLIVTDPPFGCRTELITHMLRSLMRLHNHINGLPVTPLSIFWVYPYYMANYIKQDMPELEMCDYKINYTNHSRYTNLGTAKRISGSPVRIFTNVPLELIKLPVTEGYKYCNKCERHTGVENVHCDRCRNCCSQNGQTYKHCHFCDLCVKPNYMHCPYCRRCCQREGHDCSLYQSKQHCRLCGQRGHIETSCGVWFQVKLKNSSRKNRLKNRQTVCLICGKRNHNERKCPLRCRYFKETSFMGQTQIVARYKLQFEKQQKQ